MFALLDENGDIAAYPYSVTDLRLAHPETSFPAIPSVECLADFNVVPVALTNRLRSLRASGGARHSRTGRWRMAAAVDRPEHSRCRISGRNCPVTMRQARLALLAGGHLANAETTLNALPSPQKEAALIEWEYASEIRRDSALVTGIGAALGLTELEIDTLFETAAAL